VLRRLVTGACLTLCVAHAASAAAATFGNQFIEFQLPDRWACALEGSEYVCQDTRPERKRQSIMIFAAKLKGVEDNFIDYRSHLSEPKKWRERGDKSVVSTVLQVENVVILGHPWVVSTHDDSEIVGFRTRYFATVRDDIGILFTYSAAKDAYDTLVNEFDTVIKSLKTKQRPGFTKASPAAGDAGAPEKKGEESAPTPVAPPGDSSVWPWGIAALVLTGVGMIAIRRRSSKGAMDAPRPHRRG
jgi:hypothetical protein